MAGNENGRIVSSVMAGVAFAVDGDGVGFATESYASSALYTTLASLSGAFWRIRRAKAFYVSIESNQGAGFHDLTCFLDANRPRIKRGAGRRMRAAGNPGSKPSILRGPEYVAVAT